MLLVCVTFPLLWIGGLVTTTGSGMAVPDWPTTYGYNPFLYPLTTWFWGPWDIFVEHGHRLLASLIGLVTIGLVVTTWYCERRRWVFWTTFAALLLVIFKAMLGGTRDARRAHAGSASWLRGPAVLRRHRGDCHVHIEMVALGRGQA